jgi:FlaA1/EpsC-like NDP-sugar epimerase
MHMPRLIDENIELIISRLPGVDLRGQGVLVTGGAGFLGSWMCDVLVKMQAAVVCVDNLSSGLERNIAHLLGKLLSARGGGQTP